MNRFSTLAFSIAFLTVAALNAQTITPIVIEGMNVSGVGNIQSGFGASENHSVNNFGEWIVETDTDNADTNTDGVIVRGTGTGPFALELRHGQALSSPPGATISSFDSININNSGNTSYNHFLDNTGSGNNDSGIYFNSDLIIQESNFVTAAGVSANSPWTGFFETKINSSNQILVMGSMDDPAIASTTDRILALVNPVTFNQTLVGREGSEIVSGRFVADFSTGPHEMALNDNNHAMFVVDMDGATTDDQGVVKWDGANYSFLAREGSPSAVAGRNWGSPPTALDMNNNGDWVMRGDLDGATTDDSLIVKNGTQVIAREGAGLPAIGSFLFTSFGTGAAHIAANGDVVWFGDWNDADTTKDTGIFLNGQLLVQEGVTPVGGGTVTISAVQDNISMSDNGEYIIFEGTLSDGRDGAFLIHIPEPGTISLLLIGAFAVAVRRRRA